MNQCTILIDSFIHGTKSYLWKLFCNSNTITNYLHTSIRILSKVTVFSKGHGGQIFKAFPAKNKAPDWSTSSVSQSEACFFGGKELNYLPSMLFSKNGDFSSYYTTQLALKEIWCSIIECFWSRSSDDSEVFLSNQF